MPYKLKGNCVVKADSGEVVKCHATHAKAVKHLAALYVNVEDAKEHHMQLITPKEFSARYNLTEKDFSYANAETWVIADAVSALGYLMSVARQEGYMQETDDTLEIVRLMKELVSFVRDQLDEMGDAVTEDTTAYKEVLAESVLTTKEVDGHYRWTLITGSAFEDRDGEIIAEKAFERDCNEMELGGDYGELLWWHCDGELHGKEKEARPHIALGKCDHSLVYQKLNIESGTYYDDAVGKVFSEKAARFGASKSFYHLPAEPGETGVYTFIRTKERSILPRGKEANFVTKLFGRKDKEMADTPERLAALKKEVGEAAFDALMADAKERSELAEKYLASKETKDTPEDKADAKKKDKPKDDKAIDAKASDAEAKEAKLLLAVKETVGSTVKSELEIALKEYRAETAKEMDDLKLRLAKSEKAMGLLLGIQPKGTKLEDTPTKELEGKEKEAADEIQNMVNGDANNLGAWVMGANSKATVAGVPATN